MLKMAWTYLGGLIWKVAQKTRKYRTADLLYIYLLEPILLRKNIWSRRLKWYNVESLEDYCYEKHEGYVQIEPKRERIVYEPSFWGECKGKEHFFKSASIYVAIIHDVTVIGSTGLVVAGNRVLYDACKQDIENRIDFRYGSLRKKEGNRLLVEMNRQRMEIDSAINLCGFASGNYYHFTMEILSRLGYVNSLEISEDIPILIDEETRRYSQLQQMLAIVNGKRPVVFIPKGMRCKVHTLICPSMNTWMPINVKSGEVLRLSDNLLAESGIKNILSETSNYRINQTAKKIYISRKNTQLPRIENEDEIVPFFREAGFQIVYVEQLSYEGQIKLFSSAKCVVGASGAALTNILYCHPETIVGCIIPREYSFCIYSTIAHLLGCKTLFFNPEIVSRGKHINADRYQVDEEKCKKYVMDLCAMCN